MAAPNDFPANLRAEARKMLEPHLQGLEEELQGFGDRFAEASHRIEQYLACIRNLDLQNSAALMTEAVAQARDEAIRDLTGENDKTMSFLAHFVHDSRRRETQEEILNLLLDGARMFAPRAVLFVARGNDLMGWASRGFSEDLTSKIKGWVTPKSSTPFLNGALESDSLESCNDISREEELSDLLGGETSAPWHAFPLRAIGRPVAVLLTAATPGDICKLESLCILMDVTGLCIENLALKILREMKETAAPVPAQEADKTVREGAAEPPAPTAIEEPAAAVPEQGEPPAEVTDQPSALPPEAASPSTEAPEQGEPPIEEPVVETPGTADANEATDQPESAPPSIHPPEPFFKMPSPGPPVTVTPEPEPQRTPPLREVEQMSEEEKLHAEAKRFARLLVSEIKLYNEGRVQEGRENRDLYVRLKRDIDRSREMYEKRISSSVTRKVDYFHDELVRILGENTPEKLGSDYPGPRAET